MFIYRSTLCTDIYQRFYLRICMRLPMITSAFLHHVHRLCFRRLTLPPPAPLPSAHINSVLNHHHHHLSSSFPFSSPFRFPFSIFFLSLLPHLNLSSHLSFLQFDGGKNAEETKKGGRKKHRRPRGVLNTLSLPQR